MNGSTIIAVGVFGSIGMLAWAAVALVPLLLHLWSRKRHKEASWAAMEFLLAAVQEQARRIRLEQILLLLLRMAIPVVLALALADPIWKMLPSLGSSLSSRVPHHHLFIFDTSYSMGYQVGGKTRLQQAQQVASEIIQQSPQGDGFTLVTMSNPSEVVIGVPVFSSDDALAEIAGLELRDNAANLATALDMASQTLDSVRTDFPRLRKHRVYSLSDMDVVTWRAAAQPEVRKRIGDIEAMADIITVDVGVNVAKNIGIASVHRSQPLITPRTRVAWQVTVNDFTGNSLGKHDIEMRVGGKLAAKQSVDLTTGQPTSAAFEYQFDTSGQHTVDFHLTDDGLAVDNHWYEIVTVRNTVNVLCVEGKTKAARNVAIALAPAADSNVAVRTVPDHRLSETPLTDYDAIFLCNVGRFTAQRATRMREFLKRGGGIVMFLGDRSSPENYNQLLGGGTGRPALLPAQLIDTSPYASHQLSPRDYRHPIIQPFRGQERSGLLTTPIWRYMRVALPPDARTNDSQTNSSQAKVALEFANGDPAIVEHSVLAGRFTMVAIAPSRQSVSRQAGQLGPWTAWSAWPSFPPLIQEMLSFSVGSKDQASNVTVGQPISSTLPESSGAHYVSILHANKISRVAVQEGLGPPTWVHDQTFSSGIYTVKTPNVETTDRFAVNLSDTKESRLQRVSLSELPSQFQQNSILAATDEEHSNVQMTSTPLFRLMLGLLLLLLLTESFVAWYLGNARS